MHYRREIDGLRALAVLPVILFHAGFQTFGGGFVGVDVFFVISGFLITRIITDELETKRFSVVRFYERRARRILPALFFYVTIASIGAAAFYPPHQLKEYGESLFANSVFLSNVFFYVKTDYFNDFSETAPLLHTWSLSVEEQYYLVFPIFLLLTFKFLKGWYQLLILIVAIASLLYSQLTLTTNPSASFYLIPSRFWELAVGSFLASTHVHFPFTKSQRISTFLGALGIALILSSVLAYGRSTQFPGLAALPPVLGTALVIAYARQENVVGKLLSSRLLVGTGLVSYSWYLSHHVLFAISRVYGLNLSEFATKASLIFVSLLLALLSFRFIEQPFRKGLLDRKGIFSASGLLLLVFSGFGLLLHATDGLRKIKYELLDPSTKPYLLDFGQALEARGKVWEEVLKNQDADFSDGAVQRVLILGDSKSQDFLVASTLGRFATVEFRRLRLDDLCMAPHMSIVPNAECADDFQRVVTSDLYRRANEVLLTATWQSESTPYVIDFVKRLLRDGKRVTIISTSNFNDVSSLSFVLASRPEKRADEARFFYRNIRGDWKRQSDELKEMLRQEHLNVRFLDKEDVFCDQAAKTCRLRDENGWYIYDTGHLTNNGAKFFAKRIAELGWYPEH
jgi:peptidoglycan/LPS O-acetylase OafA/YrhL